MAAETILLDTSLLVAASVKEHPGHAASRAYVAAQQAGGALLLITPQICREFLVVLTRAPIAGRLFEPREALDALAEWRTACNLVDETTSTVNECVALVERHQVRGKQVHDCNLVAVIAAHGLTRLATRNAHDFRRYGIAIDEVVP